MEFFTENEFEQFSKIVGKAYDPSNTEHKSIVESLKNGLWIKTYYWAEEVCKKLSEYSFSCEKIWSQRGWENKKRVSTFKPYTWAKIFKKGDKNKGIYFTIGVHAGKELVYKLDYQFSGNKYLSDPEKEKCERLIKPTDAAWAQVVKDDLKNHNWESLIELTINFITKYESLYDQTISSVWSNSEKRISRLVWNSNGWVIPSGKYGKSSDKDSHEAKFGFGHEEWMLDTGKLIDGYHYGFLEPIKQQQDSFAGGIYDVWLYTIDSESKKRYWVGEIKNLAVLDKADADKAYNFYKKNNWLDEMEQQLIAAGADTRGFYNSESICLFNVKYRPLDLMFNDPLIELPQNHPVAGQSRYVFAHFKEEFGINKESREDFSFIATSNLVPAIEQLKTKKYQREAKAVEIFYLHNTICEGLTRYLIFQHDEKMVRQEHPDSLGGRIDIVVNAKDGFIFYEVKTYNSLKTSIREAIGQLMEYSLWPSSKRAKELIIVTQPRGDIEEAKTYIKYLRDTYELPIYYQSYDLKNRALSEKY